MILLYCKVNEKGKIINSLACNAERPAVPKKKYDYVFKLDSWTSARNVKNMYVKDGRLVNET
ncbi:hypothetical protein ACE1TI_13515 [Alteribacillus sp. JSM 102045]|uniref:hypothetical protein n=1 Tax=Alteribacillus sp. JSM 102045 TaxID=1562101 RepID=UPI0035C25093